MEGVYSGFDDYMQSGFQYFVTVFGAAAAAHWIIGGQVESLWRWVAKSRRIYPEGMLSLLVIFGIVAGPLLAARNHMALATIVFVTVIVGTVDGARVLKQDDGVRSRM